MLQLASARVAAATRCMPSTVRGARLLSVRGVVAASATRGVAFTAATHGAALSAAAASTAVARTASTLRRPQIELGGQRCARMHSAAHGAVAASSHEPSTPSSFASLGLASPYLSARLSALGLREPTEIQRAAMPALCAGESVLLGAETGSGKSLTYLLPALDWLLSASAVSAASPAVAGEQGRRYPRVVILQPNRELCHQLEAVIASVIGPSGSRELPVTPDSSASTAAPATTQLHYACMTGTQLFPPPSASGSSSNGAQLDILICTPSAFIHNVPLVDLARTRAKAIKTLRAEALAAEEAVRTKDGDAAAAALHAQSHASLFSPSFTPLATPGAHPRSFDALSFLAAQRLIVLDEADMLLEGGFAEGVKKLLESVWIKFEPAPGLERMTTQARRNRWRREKKKPRAGSWQQQQQQQQQQGGAAEEEDLDALEAANEDSALHLSSDSSLPARPAPFAHPRQFVFVGATLSNISPLACFQYLLNTFTPAANQPPLDRMGPLDLQAREWTARGCQLQVKLSSGFHHLSPSMSSPGTVEWSRVGADNSSASAKRASKAWDPETGIDESRLRAVDAAGRRAIGADGSDLESGLSQQEQAEADARFIAAEAESMSLRSASARKIMKKTKRKPGAFGVGASSSLPLEGAEVQQQQPARLTEPDDLEKLDRTVRFLNARTWSPSELRARAKKLGHSVAAVPPMKSLLFVSGTARVDTLLLHLRALQSASEGNRIPQLSSHLQLLPYHADLKPEARAASLKLFNSSARATATSSAASAAAAADPSAPPPGITHQVLLCTSLAARGLDFAAITAPSSSSAAAAAAPSSSRGAAAQKAGFESLVQFDLARDAIDYIHRCGRMFRHRPAAAAVPAAHADATEDHTADAEDDAVAASSAPSSSSSANTAAAASVASATTRILNLYTAQDELLVRHLRAAESSSSEIVSAPASDAASSAGSASSLAVNALCPFSGKPVTAAALTTFEGRTVGFCNPGCRDRFAADPAAFPDAVSQLRIAIAQAPPQQSAAPAVAIGGAHVPDSAFSRKRRLRTKAKQQAKREEQAAEQGSHAQQRSFEGRSEEQQEEEEQVWDERVPARQDEWKQ